MVTLARKRSSLFLHIFFGVLILANFMFWSYSRNVLEKWDNVPSPPNMNVASFAGLGDEGISYRLYGYMLQNFGNTGGNFEFLKNIITRS